MRTITGFSHASSTLAALFIGAALAAQPTVQSTSPAPHANAGAATGQVAATFNQNMDAATVNAVNVVVRRASSRDVGAGVYGLGSDPKEIEFTPNVPLFPGEMVEATLTTGLKSASGSALAKPYVWRYRAAAGSGPAEFDNVRALPATGKPLLADFDGDGDLDILTYGGGTLTLSKNDGKSTFTPGPSLSLGSEVAGGYPIIVTGDVDRDGDIDLVIALTTPFGQNPLNPFGKLYKNDGSGAFSFHSDIGNPPSGPHPSGSSYRVVNGAAIGDVNGDGYPDLVITVYTQQNQLFFNDGTGFPGSGITLPQNGPEMTFSVEFADVDGDGDLDMLTAEQDSIAIRFNDGLGDFSQASRDKVLIETTNLIVADMNGDNHPDILKLFPGNNYSGEPVHVDIYFNTGSGTAIGVGTYGLFNSTFDVSVIAGMSIELPSGMTVFDGDGDGDLDVLVAQAGKAYNWQPDVRPCRYFENTGNGNLSSTWQECGSYTGTWGMATGDLDGDGDIDLVNADGYASFNTPNQSWLTITSSTSIGPAVIGESFAFGFAVSSGVGPFQWSATGLPSWLSLDAATGLLSGTPPTGAASATFTVTAHDTFQLADANVTVTLSIVPSGGAAPLTVNLANLPAAQAGNAYSTTLQASGGTAPYTWAATTLPSWLALNAASGALGGTPTAADAGLVTVTLTLTDAGTPPQSVTLSRNLDVAGGGASGGGTPGTGGGGALAIATVGLPDAPVATPYNVTLSASGGTAPYAWSANNLPSWLSLDSATGTLSGTPPLGAVGGSASFTVSVSDSAATPTTVGRSLFLFVVPPAGSSNMNTLGFGGAAGGCALTGTTPQSAWVILALALFAWPVWLKTGSKGRGASAQKR